MLDGKKEGQNNSPKITGPKALNAIQLHNQQQLQRVEKVLKEGEEVWLLDDLDTQVISGYMGKLSILSGHIFNMLASCKDEDLAIEVYDVMAHLYAVGDTIAYVRTNRVVKFKLDEK
jgi:hypothetical protein